MSLLKRFRILDQKKAVLEGESLKYKLNFPTGSYIVPLHLIYRYINLTSRRGPYSTLISIIILITGSHRIVMISVYCPSRFDYRITNTRLLFPKSKLAGRKNCNVWQLSIYLACSGKAKFCKLSEAWSKSGICVWTILLQGSLTSKNLCL